jgi:hypothetical protein
MILRIVRGRIDVQRLEELTATVEEGLRGRASATPGLVRVHLGVRPFAGDELEVVLVTCWETVDAAIAADGSARDGGDVFGGAMAGAGLVDVAYFEVDESMLRRSEAAADIVRLSIGRVARGLDVDIQRELRGRMHLLEPEMTEGYVGRRILGDAVEIAFISAWEREPAGRSLDAPLWPDISVTYDAFEVTTYRPVASAAAAR